MTQLQQTLIKGLSALQNENVTDIVGAAIVNQICGEQIKQIMAEAQAVQELSHIKSAIGFWDIQRIIDVLTKIEDQAMALKDKLNKIQDALQD